MPRSRRAGFTLVELLVALVIFVLVASSLYRVLNVSQQTSRAQTERAAMQGSLRTGIQLAMAELQEIWTDDVDNLSAITAMSATSLSYRAMRGLGLTCGLQTTSTITITNWTGLTAPTVGQGIYLFDQGATESSEADDSWWEGVISGVATGTCNNGVATVASYVLSVTGIAGPLTNVKVPGPVRTWEAMQFGLVASGGRNWLGMRVPGGAMTPLAGPLNSTGLLIRYWDDATVETADPNDVKSITLELYGETDRAANRNFSGTTESLGDTVRVRVQLRNGR